ncbi:type VI secretion protein IcmF [Pseudomonas sp. M47T1]|uniref:type VI secretion protein IcmF/TssM N-terminal domain-containing protein n=1 Tax=Pseudomonas sp. M47T1 TaxID=1179778 RepID=UPI000260885E|nr:type VI secretion protein IcmF/TssM N-terminal domain-containing protein [Pseudomonas sp. M47T1]EIK95427.1 type VI secretion protein IcmF [Pseudomonas sp. M47T1]
MSGLVLGVVLLLVIIVVAATLVGWLRSQGGTALRSFYLAVREMEHEQGVHDRYQSPWLMMLGDEGQGSQLCRHWKLQPAERDGWFGRWWADGDGAVLVVPQALFLPQQGFKVQSGAWWRLLGLLVRLRARRPLDGIIWTVDVQHLFDEAAATALGQAARKRFIDLQQRLGLSLPVYVMVTGLEEVPGGQALISALAPKGRERGLGWSSPWSAQTRWQTAHGDQALADICQALSRAILELGSLHGQLDPELYGLPERLAQAQFNLQALLDPVFQGNSQGEAPNFRGLYLTANQAAAPGLEPLSHVSASHDLVFARTLWQQRIVAERGLALVIPRLLRLRQRWQRGVAIGASVVGLLWAVAMVWSWHERARDAQELSRLTLDLQKNYVVSTDDSHRLEQARENAESFWYVLEEAPRWHFSAVALPSSWFSDRDQQLEQALTDATDLYWLNPMRQLMGRQLQDLLAINAAGRRGNLDGDDPAQWATYQRAVDLVGRAVALQDQNRLLSEALGNSKTPLDELVELNNSLLGQSLNVATLRMAPMYNRLLVQGDYDGLKPLDLAAQRPQASQNLQDLMQSWLDQYFLADNFVRPAGYLKLHLGRLAAGSEGSLKDLEDIDALIDNLQNRVDATNAAWGHGKAGELVSGYQALLGKVRDNVMFGPSLADSLDSQAASLQQRFRDQWIARDGSRDNLLTQTGNSQLALQGHVSALDNAIETLFKRDFVALALRSDEADAFEIDNIDSDGLNRAVAYFNSYKSYANEQMPSIPAAYRTPLLKAAQNAAAQAMLVSLQAPAGAVVSLDQGDFNLSTDQAMVLYNAFTDVQHPELATLMRNHLNRRALADISAVLSDIEAQPLFRGRVDIASWDGSKNLGLRLFRATDAADLKQDLGQQFAAIMDLAERGAPAVAWVKTQQQSLPAADLDKVRRLSELQDEMQKYKAQNPASSPMLVEQLVSHDFNDMDVGSCLQILGSANLPAGNGELSRLAVGLQQQAMSRCRQLQVQRASAAWVALADYFNQYLAGRFPFAPGVQASDADPARVQHLLELIDGNLADAQAGLAMADPVGRRTAQDFLQRLQQSRAWLGALLMRDKSGMTGVDLDVRWRTDRDQERGADQVIAWGLNAGSQQLVYPGAEQPALRWNIGEPVRLTLRWAKNSDQRPVSDPSQPSLAVSDLQAGWEYDGPWALLRLMRSHDASQRQPNVDFTEFPLSLQLPVHGQAAVDNLARLYVRLSVMSQGSKQPLSIQPLPWRAPQSPYASLNLPAPLASNEVAP